VSDHLSTWRFCPTRTATENLKREGLRTGVIGVGDVMYESFLRLRSLPAIDEVTARFGLEPNEYYFLTCHRAENVDNPERLRRLSAILFQLDRPVIFAVHPRARKNLIRHHHWVPLRKTRHLRLVPPLDHQTTLALTASARAVLTDSGGLQREAYWSRTPCLSLRDRTEWVETVRCGANRLVDLDADRVRRALARRWRIGSITDPFFRNRTPSSRIVARLKRDLLGCRSRSAGAHRS
jgi:UDP-N-acetylglucosamine 2-epimerase